MKKRIILNITDAGNIEVLESDEEQQPLLPKSGTDQVNPKGFYVYAHCDINGRVFYVGKGIAGAHGQKTVMTFG